MSNRWQRTDAPRGDDYDARWRSLAATGHNIHGEADLVEALLRESGATRVLDGGCGTGRVAIELARRGFSVVGVDADPGMLATARGKAPGLHWVLADLAEAGRHLVGGFDLVVLAGNVMIFLEPGSEGPVIDAMSTCLRPGGLLVSGFQIRSDRLPLDDYDRLAEAAGLRLVDRWATWDRQPFDDGEFAVSVHRKPPVFSQAVQTTTDAGRPE
jgi:SAM-dependent methyltransferase